MTKYEELNLLRSWEADARERAELLAQHLKAVLEVAYTWQPDYATKMDMDTLAFAATEVGFEPSNVEVTGARRRGALAARRKIDNGRFAARVPCRSASG